MQYIGEIIPSTTDRGFQFWQKKSQAIIVHSPVQADCIYKVISEAEIEYCPKAHQHDQRQKSLRKAIGFRSSTNSSSQFLMMWLAPLGGGEGELVWDTRHQRLYRRWWNEYKETCMRFWTSFWAKKNNSKLIFEEKEYLKMLSYKMKKRWKTLTKSWKSGRLDHVQNPLVNICRKEIWSSVMSQFAPSTRSATLRLLNWDKPRRPLATEQHKDENQGGNGARVDSTDAIPSTRKWLQLLIGIKIENNRPASNYRHYSFIINRKWYGGRKITDVTGVTDVTVLIQKEHWKNHGRLLEVHISKHSPFSCQDRGRLSDKHISKHSLFHVGRNSEDHGRLFAVRRLTRIKKRGNFSLQEYFRRWIYFLLRF